MTVYVHDLMTAPETGVQKRLEAYFNAFIESDDVDALIELWKFNIAACSAEIERLSRTSSPSGEDDMQQSYLRKWIEIEQDLIVINECDPVVENKLELVCRRRMDLFHDWASDFPRTVALRFAASKQ